LVKRLTGTVLAAIGAALLVPVVTPVKATGVPALSHVFVIVMENHAYGEIIGSSSAPYINSLAAKGGLATSYTATTHPSLPNYLALTGASTFGITSDCTTCWVNATNVADKVESAGKSWKAYEESMPSACFVGDSGSYAQKHDPFIYYNDVRTNTSRCQSHVVPYTQLATDLASASTTPNYAFITPNMCNDMHDCAVSTGDSWLQQQVPTILNSAAFTTQPSLLAVIWDEDDSSAGNQVPAILVGSGITAGLRSSRGYNHYSLLATIEVGLGLGTLTTNDAGAATMTDFFGASTPSPSPSPGWSTLGGVTTSDPTAASWASGHVDAFARGADHALWHRAWTGTSWGAWQSLGGGLTSSPSAVSGTSNRIDVFARGGDSALWHRWWDGTTWQAWESIGGALSDGPGVASWSATSLEVFVRGRDNALWHRSWNGTSWQAWQSLGGVLTSDPGSVASGTNRLEVFGRGADSAVWHRSFDGMSWGAWQSLGGRVAAPAAASSCVTGAFQVFAVGVDSSVWSRTFNGSTWGPWTKIGGTWSSGPGAVCQPGTTTTDVFERGMDGTIWRLELT